MAGVKAPLMDWAIIWHGESYLQPDQINMSVLLWFLVTSNASVRYCTIAYTGQVTFYKVPVTHGHVQLVSL